MRIAFHSWSLLSAQNDQGVSKRWKSLRELVTRDWSTLQPQLPHALCDSVCSPLLGYARHVSTSKVHDRDGLDDTRSGLFSGQKQRAN